MFSFRDQGSPGLSSISFRGSNTSLQVFRFQKSLPKPGGSLFSNPRLRLFPPLFASFLGCICHSYGQARPFSPSSAPGPIEPPKNGRGLKLSHNGRNRENYPDDRNAVQGMGKQMVNYLLLIKLRIIFDELGSPSEPFSRAAHRRRQRTCLPVRQG